MKGEKILTRVICGVAAVVAARSLITRIFDPDIWWQMAHGREMLHLRHLLSTDIYSHTMFGLPQVNFEWLSQIFLYLVWSVGGPVALIAWKVTAGVLVGALLLVGMRRHGASGPWLALIAWLGFWSLRPRLNERTELATLIAFPLVMLIVERALASPASRRNALFLITVIVAVAANLHGGWIYIPGLLFLRAVGALWAREDGARARFLGWATVLTGLAGLATPYGPKVLGVHVLHVNQLSGGLSHGSLLSEWKPTTAADAPYFWALYLVTLVALALVFRRRRHVAMAWAPAVLLFAVWGAQSYRNAALFVFPALGFLASVTPAWSARVRRGAWAVFVALVALKTPVLVNSWPTPPVQARLFPIGACAFVRDHNIQGNMFNTWEHGGYIAWTLGPERKNFIDGRYSMFPVLRDLAEASLAGKFGTFLEERGVDYALVDPEFSAKFAPPGGEATLRTFFPESSWALVFWDDAGLVLVKRVPKFDVVIARFEYRALRPDAPEALHGLKDAERAVAERELARHQTEVGFSVIAQQMAGALGR